MKVFEINSVYSGYRNYFYLKYPNAGGLDYIQHKALVDSDSYGGIAPYAPFLEKLGCQMVNVLINMHPLQKSWAQANGVNSNDENEIILEQLKTEQPDILWYNHYDEELLNRILLTVKSIQKVIGWVGSAIPKTNIWNRLDMILSCAPEAVDYFNSNGHKSLHLHHAFDPNVISRLERKETQDNLVFIGQIVRSKDFHQERERILLDLAAHVDLSIYSSMYESFSFKMKMLKRMEQTFNETVKYIGRNTLLKEQMKKQKTFNRILEKAPVSVGVDPLLKRSLKPAVYGMSMYNVIHNANMVLNIHADSSPLYASNMRLWETTGVGGCLITDWRKNMHELFVPDEEVLVYKSIAECNEKVNWLMNNPKERSKIAVAGQKRCLAEHTYEQRTQLLWPILKQILHHD